MDKRQAILNAFGNRLREVRTSRGFSQEKLAELAGFDRTYISLLERGGRNPSLINIIRLARTLTIDPRELLILIK